MKAKLPIELGAYEVDVFCALINILSVFWTGFTWSYWIQGLTIATCQGTQEIGSNLSGQWNLILELDPREPRGLIRATGHKHFAGLSSGPFDHVVWRPRLRAGEERVILWESHRPPQTQNHLIRQIVMSYLEKVCSSGNDLLIKR